MALPPSSPHQISGWTFQKNSIRLLPYTAPLQCPLHIFFLHRKYSCFSSHLSVVLLYWILLIIYFLLNKNSIFHWLHFNHPPDFNLLWVFLLSFNMGLFFLPTLSVMFLDFLNTSPPPPLYNLFHLCDSNYHMKWMYASPPALTSSLNFRFMHTKRLLLMSWGRHWLGFKGKYYRRIEMSFR